MLQSTLENLGVAAKVENAGYSYLIILLIVLFILSLTWVLLSQMKKLKQYSKDKLTLFDNGAHLGFLYRSEFLENLKQTIAR